jgi:predicted  nucleic acid-binding Zn-ribbon protein
MFGLEEDLVNRILELEKENADLQENLRIADETSGNLNKWIRNLQEQRDRLEKESLEWEGRCHKWEKLCKGYQKAIDVSIKEQIASMKGSVVERDEHGNIVSCYNPSDI